MSGPFGSEFATPEKFIQAGFDRIITDTTIPDCIKKSLYVQYNDAHRSGSPRAELAVFNACVTEDFGWPWFERHRAQFVERGLVPYMWRRSGRNYDKLSFKLKILAHSLVMAIYAGVKEGRWLELDERFMAARCEVIVPILGCQVEEQVAKQFNLGLLHGTPPFFPGDRSSITLKTFAKMKERGFTSETYKRKPLA